MNDHLIFISDIQGNNILLLMDDLKIYVLDISSLIILNEKKMKCSFQYQHNAVKNNSILPSCLFHVKGKQSLQKQIPETFSYALRQEILTRRYHLFAKLFGDFMANCYQDVIIVGSEDGSIFWTPLPFDFDASVNDYTIFFSCNLLITFPIPIRHIMQCNMEPTDGFEKSTEFISSISHHSRAIKSYECLTTHICFIDFQGSISYFGIGLMNNTIVDNDHELVVDSLPSMVSNSWNESIHHFIRYVEDLECFVFHCVTDGHVYAISVMKTKICDYHKRNSNQQRIFDSKLISFHESLTLSNWHRVTTENSYRVLHMRFLSSQSNVILFYDSVDDGITMEDELDAVILPIQRLNDRTSGIERLFASFDPLSFDCLLDNNGLDCLCGDDNSINNLTSSSSSPIFEMHEELTKIEMVKDRITDGEGLLAEMDDEIIKTASLLTLLAYDAKTYMTADDYLINKTWEDDSYTRSTYGSDRSSSLSSYWRVQVSLKY
jgi:hypothetical protein